MNLVDEIKGLKDEVRKLKEEIEEFKKETGLTNPTIEEIRRMRIHLEETTGYIGVPTRKYITKKHHKIDKMEKL